jgi:folylpolyglutamate synthase
LLGQTIPEIAWHKAGIAKPNSILVSVPQPPEAMEIIQRRCIEKKVLKISKK